MRILLISWGYPPHVTGGVGKHVFELVAAFGKVDQSGSWAVDLLTPRFAGGEVVEQLTPSTTVYRVDMPLIERDPFLGVTANNQFFVEYANRLAKRRPYDLIHVHDWSTGIAGLTLKRQWQVPLIVTLHGTERGRYQRNPLDDRVKQVDQFEQKLCEEATRVIVCSQFVRREIQSYWAIPLSKINVIVNGVRVRTGQGCSPEELAVLRRRYAPAGQKLLFFISRISYEKGITVLLRAMPHILIDHPDVRLLVAGENGEKLRQLTYELNIEKAVDFLGYIRDDERDCLYQLVDATIIPSLYEPFGIAALEAMAFGCSVIASHVGGLGEIVKHRENGLLVQPNDPQRIAQAVSQLFTDPIAAQEWRWRALEEIKTTYNWERIAATTLQIYQAASS